MAKKSVANTRGAKAEPRLSFDGGSRHRGGFGNWYPAPLSHAELEQTSMESGKVLPSNLAAYSAGCLIGSKAAKEYVHVVRADDSNFHAEESSGGDLAHIMIDMLMGTSADDSMRRGQCVGFFGVLYAYMAFGIRSIREADKKESANNRRPA